MLYSPREWARTERDGQTDGVTRREEYKQTHTLHNFDMTLSKLSPNVPEVAVDWEARTVQLRNSVAMPLLGLGTSHNGGYSHATMVYALRDVEYRLVDTAKRYGTEAFLAPAIEAAGVPRSSLFLTTKIWPSDYGRAETRASFQGSLSRMGLDYLDLYLIHYPEVGTAQADRKWTLLADTWRTMVELHDEGHIRAVGVSNFSAEDLEHLAEHCSFRPMVNQLEFHPYYQQRDLVDYCRANNILVQGYCPLGSGQLINEPVVQSVAAEVSRTPGQVLIRYSLQRGVPTIPKSTKMARVAENASVFDFGLSDEQMRRLDGLQKGVRYQAVDTIREKIDENLPDGYKLEAGLRERLLQT